ncbi:MAG: hypothetical protein WCG75_12095, partial [Armatimonadota bacterium]
MVAWAMRRAVVLGVLVICGGCSSQKKADPVAGSYVGWQVLNGELYAADGTRGTTEKLELKADGTFHYQLKSNVMMTIASQADGTYKVFGNILSFTGRLKGKVDDGYKKDDINQP